MTTPQLPPMTAAKAWVAGVGSVLGVIVGAIQIARPFLPTAWAVAIDAVIALATVVGVYFIPNKPKEAQ